MKLKIKLLFLTLLTILFIPVGALAFEEYDDKIYDIVGEKKSDVVTVYFFYSSACPHCKKENQFLDTLEEERKDIVIKRYEVTSSSTNSEYLRKAKERLGITSQGVPFTVIGDHYYQGYSDGIGTRIKRTTYDYLGIDIDENYFNDDDNNKNKETEKDNSFELPLFGKVDAKKISIPLVAVVLGLIDGFNPCAMWVLLFLISMLLNMKDRKKMWILGFTFLFTSAFIYFLAMLGISIVVGMDKIPWIRLLIAVVAIVGGLLNLRSYINTPKDGCQVVDEKKRKKYLTKIKAFTSEANLALALVGVIGLAASVNLVELACSAGFPTIFVEILTINNITSVMKILYILLYIVFFLLDDMVVFIVAMTSLKVTGITTKYNRLSHLVGGILMILIGILLVFKPEWIMFNFS